MWNWIEGVVYRDGNKLGSLYAYYEDDLTIDVYPDAVAHLWLEGRIGVRMSFDNQKQAMKELEEALT